MKTTLNDYTTEQLQDELDKRNLERYSEYALQEEIKRRNKEVSTRILSCDTELVDACIRYNIDINKINYIDKKCIHITGEEIVYIHIDSIIYKLKRDSTKYKYIMDSIMGI